MCAWKFQDGWLRIQAVLGAALLLALLNGCATVDPEGLKVSTVRLSESSECRLVHFTDLHYRGDRVWLEKLVRRINEQRPQFVCFTGDFVQEPRFLDEALALLAGVKAPIYGVPGNHDLRPEIHVATLKHGFARTGGAWLVDESVTLPGGRVRIHGAASLAPVREPPQTGILNLLLTHYPVQADQNPGHKYDLILAGHTHGGQVRIPGIGALKHTYGAGHYEYGLYRTAAGPMYVSSGVGYSRLNLRIACPPEIVLIER